MFLRRPPLVIAACLSFAAFASAQTWETHGPYGGTFEAIAFSPNPPGAVYGGNRAGIFQSDDHGRTWAETGCELGDAIVLGLAVVPQSVDPPPPPVLFAATYGGLFRSIDGGGTWSLVAGGPDDGFLAVAVDPSDPTRIYAGAANDGLFRSMDGGETFEPASPPLCPGDFPVAVHSLLVLQGAVLAASSCGVYRTSDGGDSWSLVATNGIFSQATSLAGAFSSSAVLASFFAGPVVASGDSGAHWSPSGAGLPSDDVVWVLAADPRHPEVVYAGELSSGVFRSSDGGAHWVQSNAGLASLRILGLSVDPFDSAVLAAAGDGLYRSDDGGSSWQLSDAGLRGTSFAGVAVAADAVYAGAFVRGDVTLPDLFASTDGAQRWEQRSTLGFDDPLRAVYAPRDRPGLVYATSSETARLSRSRDGGETWSSLDGSLPPAVTACRGADSCAVFLAVADDGALYTGGYDAIFRSTDDGDTWQKLALPVPAGLAGVDPRDSARVYAESVAGQGADFLVSEDGGITWRVAGTAPSPIFSLAFDRRSFGPIYGLDAGTRRVVWSDDGGAHWTEAAADFPRGTEFPPLKLVAHEGVLYVPTGAGVYRSLDRGEHWEPFGDCLASPAVSDLAAGADGRSLYAATNGGVFRIAIERPVRKIAPVPPSSAAPVHGERRP